MSSPVMWQPPQLMTDDGQAWPVRHVWCVGRNYAEHAREMGADPSASPLFFSKPATTLVQGPKVRYPAHTQSLHHEVELALVLGMGGRDWDAEQALQAVAGYAVAIDLTRRDVQAQAKQAGHPWEMAKAFDQSAPIGSLVAATQWQPQPDHGIRLSVNGQLKQCAKLNEMIWPVPALLAALSKQVTLWPGDVVLTGTPAGVGPLEVGDVVVAELDGLPSLQCQMVA